MMRETPGMLRRIVWAIALLSGVSAAMAALLLAAPEGEARIWCAVASGVGLLCGLTACLLTLRGIGERLTRWEDALLRLERGDLTGARQEGGTPGGRAALASLRAVRDARRVLDEMTAGRLLTGPATAEYAGDYLMVGEGLERLLQAQNETFQRLRVPCGEMAAEAARAYAEARALTRAAVLLAADAERLSAALSRLERADDPALKAVSKDATRLAAALSGQAAVFRRMGETSRLQAERGRRLTEQLGRVRLRELPKKEPGRIALPGGGSLHYVEGAEK